MLQQGHLNELHWLVVMGTAPRAQFVASEAYPHETAVACGIGLRRRGAGGAIAIAAQDLPLFSSPRVGLASMRTATHGVRCCASLTFRDRCDAECVEVDCHAYRANTPRSHSMNKRPSELPSSCMDTRDRLLHGDQLLQGVRV